MIIIIILLFVFLGAIMVATLPKVVCPTCGNKVLIMHSGKAMECEKCKTRFLIDTKTRSVIQVLSK